MNTEMRETKLRSDLDFIMGAFQKPRQKVYLKSELCSTLQSIGYQRNEIDPVLSEYFITH